MNDKICKKCNLRFLHPVFVWELDVEKCTNCGGDLQEIGCKNCGTLAKESL